MSLWLAKDYIQKALNRWDLDGKHWAQEALKELEQILKPDTCQEPSDEFVKEAKERLRSHDQIPPSCSNPAEDKFYADLKEALTRLGQRAKRIAQLEGEKKSLQEALRFRTDQALKAEAKEKDGN